MREPNARNVSPYAEVKRPSKRGLGFGCQDRVLRANLQNPKGLAQ